MRIKLERDNGTFCEVEVPVDHVARKAILVFEGVHYIFKQLGGRFFTLPTFTEVEPPLHIDAMQRVVETNHG